MNRWGLATGLAAALALYGPAQAQSATGGSPSAPPPSGSTSGTRDTPAASERSGQESQGSGSSTMGRESGTTTRESGSTASGAASTGTAQRAQKLDDDLQESLEKIHAANQAEVHMAQVGQQNAQSPQVKQFAQKLGEDHQKLDQKLTQTVQSLGATLEGKDFQKEHEKAMKDMDKLQKRTGAEFDREFMDHMVKGHERSLEEVKDAAKEARKNNHTELASLLEQAQTGMQGHLDQAKQIRDSLKRSGTATGTGSGAADQSGTSGRAGPTGASGSGAGGPGTGTGSAGSGSNPTVPGRDAPPSGGSQQPGGGSMSR